VKGQTLGHYEIERRIGAGGMGMVYAARDTKLHRQVAIKLIHEGLDGEDFRRRLWQEARGAAATSHPSICQVFEVGEDAGRLFIVMELLEGETLEDRLQYGPLDLDQALRVGLTLLDTMAALHRRGMIHRDLKPSNVFLLTDGRVKLLDFGLVRATTRAAAPRKEDERHAGAGPEDAALSHPGMGSPGYMAPEQILAQPVDARTDLFSLGVVLYETICACRVFPGSTLVDIEHAVLNVPPKPLTGDPRTCRVSDVLLRAMALNPADRYASAEDMARQLRAIQHGALSPSKERATRLAVLPFRMLRPDPDRDFLGPSLADAIVMSLAGIRSLVVRSTATTARFATPTPDLEAMARELDVDVVLLGTVLAAGDRCRASVQLVEAPSGRVMWSGEVDTSSRDIFEVQDSITRDIVASLELPLTARERGNIGQDVPASPQAYEWFLRGNELSRAARDPAAARDLYLLAIEADPQFAPAWARLSHCSRVLGKYYPQNRKPNYQRAQDALRRAFTLRPDYPFASLVQAQLDLDLGRTEQALEDLLGVVERNPNDSAGFAGLVNVLRYLGLTDASLRAHQRARKLDPQIRTSLGYTLLARGDFDAAASEGDPPGYFAMVGAVARMDREAARAAVNTFKQRQTAGPEDLVRRMLEPSIDKDVDAVWDLARDFHEFPDPEGVFLSAMGLLLAGDLDRGGDMLRRSITGGFYSAPSLDLPIVAAPELQPQVTEWRRLALGKQAAALERYGDRLREIGLLD
jgi:serine/threonine protein kinase/tetratricopeptide (TPR) repeat protein